MLQMRGWMKVRQKRLRNSVHCHFYKYTELGNAEDTLRDIQSLGVKIQSAIAELFGEVSVERYEYYRQTDVVWLGEIPK